MIQWTPPTASSWPCEAVARDRARLVGWLSDFRVQLLIADMTTLTDSPPSRRFPTAIDLFSGAGGLTQGLRWARFKVLGAVEIDPLAVETYRANFSGVRLWRTDIRELSVARVLRELQLRPGELHLLAGCPPCQGFSTLRSLNGHQTVDDERNDLVLQFERFVRGLRPKAVMLENVPGLATDGRLTRLTTALREMGYAVTTEVLDASQFGVPQRRRRMILVAGRRGHIHLAAKEGRTRTVRDAISHLPKAGRSGDPLHDVSEQREKKTIDLIARVPKNGGSRSDLGDAQLGCHIRCDGFHDVYGRMEWDAVAPTITSGCVNPSKGRFLHPDQNRAITLREAALLQGFPPDYVFSLRRGKFATAAMIGNALPPEFVKRHALQIREHVTSAVGRPK
jgi:DNA (cytosine-5)-methyltransferase 1